jgi:predicted RNase H-like HicB family nuclease
MIMLNFSTQDLAFMTQRGSEPKHVEKQFAFFKSGFDFANINRNVSIGDGIVRFSDQEAMKWICFYEQFAQKKEIVKFVPASGAASRMFKDLYEALQSETNNLSDKAKHYLEKIKDFAFYDDLEECVERIGYSIEDLVDETSKALFEYLLEEKGLNYGNLPKGLLKFHKYVEGPRTALEEHLVESAKYAQSGDKICRLHFTVSPDHLDRFNELVAQVKEKYENRFGVTYQISYSIQAPATDTLAAELDNTPFRDKNGNLLFRPGGHGALINNLNGIHADLVFVKNIDNVITEDQLESTIIYKKALAGYLLYLQEKSFDYQRRIWGMGDEGFGMRDEECGVRDEGWGMRDEVVAFAKNELMIQFEKESPTVDEVLKKLHRPMRICGVVKNVGEPGGGPFWVTNRKGETSLQIVESSQINMNNPEQKAFFASASHFNPVDMFCCYKDVKGNFFDLNKYVDPYTGFISEKTYEGRPLVAMELPGLWNGAMADWITIFVEVPLSTFNPVKTVFDLLKR